jgi:hypothetical protein
VPILSPPAAAQDAVLDAFTNVTRRLEVYEYDGTTLWAGAGLGSRIVEGSVSVDATRDERRTLDCVLDNTDGALRHDPYNGLWYDKVIKIWRGVKYWSFDPISGLPVQETYEAQLGEFLIDRIEADSFPNLIKITGRDFTKKMLNSKLTQGMQFPAGTSVEAVVKALAANAGITKFLMPTTGKTVGDTVFERGTERYKVAKQVAETAGYDLFFDASGYLVMQQFKDPTTAPIEYVFKTGSTLGNLVKFTKSSNDSRVYNHIVITGDEESQPALDGTQGIIFAEAKNTYGASPTRIERIGDRTFFYASAFFTTNQQAQEVANSWLKIKALEEFNMNFDALVVPWLDANSIVEIIDPDGSDYEPTRFLLDSFTIPLALAPMTGVGRRVTIVGTAGT